MELQNRETAEKREEEKRGKTKTEPVRDETEERKRDREYDPTLRSVCVAWVETAPRSPTGRIIIPILAHVQSGARGAGPDLITLPYT